MKPAKSSLQDFVEARGGVGCRGLGLSARNGKSTARPPVAAAVAGAWGTTGVSGMTDGGIFGMTDGGVCGTTGGNAVAGARGSLTTSASVGVSTLRAGRRRAAPRYARRRVEKLSAVSGLSLALVTEAAQLPFHRLEVGQFRRQRTLEVFSAPLAPERPGASGGRKSRRRVTRLSRVRR